MDAVGAMNNRVTFLRDVSVYDGRGDTERGEPEEMGTVYAAVTWNRNNEGRLRDGLVSVPDVFVRIRMVRFDLFKASQVTFVERGKKYIVDIVGIVPHKTLRGQWVVHGKRRA